MQKYKALINMGTVLDEWKEVYLVSEVDATIKEKDAELFVVRQSLFAEAITVGGLKQSLNEAREQIAALQMYKDATLGKESERERQIASLTSDIEILRNMNRILMDSSAAGAKKHADKLYAMSETIDQWIKELEK